MSSDQRPWVELDKPKPARVTDHRAYWAEPPEATSERAAYWLRQIERGWLPSRRISSFGYDDAAEWYGVYIWEYWNLICPAIEARRTA